VATKADLDRLEATLRAEIADLWAELKTGLAEVTAGLGNLEARLYRHLWIMAAGIVSLTVSLTVTLVKLLL
jgi:hypothetical protein